MIQITPQMKILVAIEAVDGRKGIDSLARLCEEKLQADPFSGCLFLFRSRRGTSIRILVYDGQGFWLARKRLSKGRFVWWPDGKQPTRTLEAHQAQLLLAAGNPETKAAPVWRRVSRWQPFFSCVPFFALRHCGMPMQWKHRGRIITPEDIIFIQQLIANNPESSRRALSAKLCEAWQWKQANGAARDMVCRGLLLMLHRAGEIELPPIRFRPPNPLADRSRPASMLIDRTRMEGTLKPLLPIHLERVRRTADEVLFNSLIEDHHYLGYEQPVGEHLKYVVWTQERPIACVAWSSAPRHLGCRDRFIGWSGEARRRNIRFIAYNTRFLILPWIRIPHLASYILGRMARVVSKDWKQLYKHPIYFLETFVDTERFRGTCYRAANWIELGYTTGRGKNDQTHRPNRSIKQMLGYPLTPRFRELLQQS